MNGRVLFESIHIDGFATLRDTGLEGLPDGLVLIEGPNGAGKTTFFEFTRTLLFGFGKPKSKDPLFERLNDSGMPCAGGEASLRLNGARVRLCREMASRPGKVSIDPSKDEATLFPGLTKEVFCNVFTIDLNILGSQKLDDKVRQEINAAVAGTGRHALPSLIRQCEKGHTDIFVKKQRVEGVGERLVALRAVDEELRLKEQDAQTYSRLQTELSEVELKLGETRRTRKEAGQKQRRMMRVRAGYDPDRELQEIERELEQLPLRIGLASGDWQRYEGERELTRSTAEAVDKLNEQLAANRRLLTQLEPDAAVLALENDIEALSGSRNEAVTLPQDCSMLQETARESQVKAADALRSLDMRADEAWLNALPEGVMVADGGRLRSKRIAHLEASVQAARENEQTGRIEHDRAKERAAQARREFEERFSTAADSDGTLLADREALEAARAALTDLAALRVERSALQARMRTAQTQPTGRPIASLGIFAVALIVLPVAGYALAGPTGALVLGAIVLGAAGLIALLERTTRRPGLEHPNGQVEEELRACESKLAASERSLAEACAPRGWEVTSHQELVRIERALAQREESMAQWDTARRELERLDERLEDAAAKSSALVQELEQALKDWEDWLTAEGYPPQIAPAGFEPFLTSLQEARLARRAAEERQNDLRRAQTRLEALLELVRLLQGKLSVSPTAREELPGAIDHLTARLNQAQEARIKKEGVGTRSEQLEGDLREKQAALARLEARIQERFQRCGARSENEYRVCVEDFERRADLLRRKKECENNLKVAMGDEISTLEAFRREIESVDWRDFPEALKDQEAGLEALEIEEKSLEMQREDLRVRIRQLEEDTKPGQLAQEREEIRAEVRQLAFEWCRHRLTRMLLEEARAHFIDAHQGPVVDNATDILRQLTGDPNARISTEDNTNFIVHADGYAARDYDRLNRSLAERLLLSLRLGYIDYYATKNLCLPVVMDDVLVNFDEAHQLNAAKTLLDFAARHQVIYLTCHSGTCALFERAASESGTTFDAWELKDRKFRRKSCEEQAVWG